MRTMKVFDTTGITWLKPGASINTESVTMPSLEQAEALQRQRFAEMTGITIDGITVEYLPDA